MTRALIVIAHGSRAAAANDEFRGVVGQLDRTRLGYAHIEVAFLEAAAPALSGVVECLVAGGAQAIDVYPLFFNRGRHVAEDLPNLVASISNQHPQLALRLLPYFGAFDGLGSAMMAHIQQGVVEDR
jgi:sirohydrochlorin ferrochelatase